jgi:tungstate transport system ATP-binding protein
MTMRAPVCDLPISLEDASVAVGAVTILAPISLALAAGPPTVLIGPNGAGKTTLLRLAMGLIPPSRGRVTSGAGGRTRRRRIARSCSSAR